MQDNEINQWNLLIHLSQLSGFVIPLGNIIVPLILWQIKKDEDIYIDQHGKEVINWQISLLLYSIISLILSLFFIGLLFLIILAFVYVVFAIIGAVKAKDGELLRYPGSITFIK